MLLLDQSSNEIIEDGLGEFQECCYQSIIELAIGDWIFFMNGRLDQTSIWNDKEWKEAAMQLAAGNIVTPIELGRATNCPIPFWRQIQSGRQQRCLINSLKRFNFIYIICRLVTSSEEIRSSSDNTRRSHRAWGREVKRLKQIFGLALWLSLPNNTVGPITWFESNSSSTASSSTTSSATTSSATTSSLCLLFILVPSAAILRRQIALAIQRFIQQIIDKYTNI